MRFTPKKLFLIDGLGAAWSCFMLGFVLIRFDSIFGMPAETLRLLAAGAALLAVYSLTNHLVFSNQWRRRMKILAITNLIYCCISLGYVVVHSKVVTGWDVLYFFLEVLVIVALAAVEWRTANRSES